MPMIFRICFFSWPLHGCRWGGQGCIISNTWPMCTPPCRWLGHGGGTGPGTAFLCFCCHAAAFQTASHARTVLTELSQRCHGVVVAASWRRRRGVLTASSRRPGVVLVWSHSPCGDVAALSWHCRAEAELRGSWRCGTCQCVPRLGGEVGLCRSHCLSHPPRGVVVAVLGSSVPVAAA